jgi:16S rRNA (uracil1498-N3)-methyltransferase
MTCLFLTPDQFSNDTARITGADHLHLARVLRARPGQPLVLLDNRGNAFRAVVVAVEKAETLARIEGPYEMPPEPAIEITVAQALGKGDKFEQVIQHGTEVGASRFIPLQADRSVVEIPPNRMSDRLARWRQIARGAAEQSGRRLIPEVTAPVATRELRPALAGADALLALHTGPQLTPLATALKMCQNRSAYRRLAVAVGPEGGWSHEELKAVVADQPDFAPVSLVTLGPRILRTETAALVAISQILFYFAQFEA